VDVVLIDDARLFDGTDDYPTMSELMHVLQKNFPNHRCEVEGDIIRVLPTTPSRLEGTKVAL